MSFELRKSRFEISSQSATIARAHRGALGWVVAIGVLVAANGTAAPVELTAEPVSAQSAGGSPKSEELAEIQVTGTRIVGGGYDAPNPITTVSAARLEELAITDIGEALNRIPSFRATLTPQTTEDGAPTNLGQRIVDLRGLGANRTLVLVDGRRFVPSNSQGTVDLNNIPTNLIDRVEVVTGGASALYGADAVAGVVNLILDKKFSGLDLESSFGRSQAGDKDTVYLSLKGGTDFGGGNGHLIVGAEFENDDGTGGCSSRDWCNQNTNILANPTPGVNGLPANLRLSNLFAVNSPNGLIISGALAGTTFTPSGSPTPFNYGKLPGFVFMQGGDSDNGKQLWLEGALVSVPVQRDNIFGHADYDFSSSIQGFAELSYGRVTAKSDMIPPIEFPTSISVNNPYIPASIRPAMLADGETSFLLKRQNNDFGDLLGKSNDVTTRFAAGLKGTLGDTWHWDAYYQYGRHTNDSQIANNRINANWAQAVDAVLAPNGQIVCASTLTNPGNGCHPVDLFGSNQSLPAAKAYVNGTSWQTRVLTEHAAAANMSGSPIRDWAGPVSIAGGLEFRRDTADGAVDPISAMQGWWNNTSTPISGSVQVSEAYLETDVPLAPGLVMNGAVRETHYDTTGSANTWKVGLVWDATQSLRLRTTLSRDFRAPNMDELFKPANSTPTILIDPKDNSQAFVTQHQGGNVNLKPESARTFTAGLVFQSRWSGATNLRASLDYYRIKIEDAVDIVNPQTTLDRCAAGLTYYCQFITRGPAGNITDLEVTVLNLDKLETSGLELAADYTVPLSVIFGSSAGVLDFSLMTTYVNHQKLTDSNGNTVERAGQTGLELQGTPGMPRYRVNLLTSYKNGPATVALEGVFISKGIFDPELKGPDSPDYNPYAANSINDNSVSSAWYANLSAKYAVLDRAAGKVEVFAGIDNLFDRQPPFLPGFHNPIFFDNIGRYYRAGVRVKLK